MAKIGELAILVCLGVILQLYVTESTKNGLIAYRKVLRKPGLNYLKGSSSPMTGLFNTNFSHIIQQFLTI